MSMHDWTRVTAGIYHDFHNSWITELRNALNSGLLPEKYYALGEQRAGDMGPDVLALHWDGNDDNMPVASSNEQGMIAVAQSPPQTRLSQEADDAMFFLSRQRNVVIRHSTGDRIVAMIEIVSPANKHARQTVEEFVEKVVDALREGIHVLVIDPFPPSRHDEHGMHGAIWEQLSAETYQPPAGLPLTLVGYRAKQPPTAYIEPICVGSTLLDMPLFLTPDHYIATPLESTYQRAWSGVPQRWRRVIENENF
jgi:hypothetical protein